MQSALRIGIVAVVPALFGEAAFSQAPIYDPDPNHPWNRLHDVIYTRRDWVDQRIGADSLDPLRWRDTRYLRVNPSRAAAVAAADAFLERHDERLIADPLRRVMLVHDLWAIFDSLANASPRLYSNSESFDDGPLRDRLVRIIQRVALKQEEIERLPDNYADAVHSNLFSSAPEVVNGQPYLPDDLFEPNGPWVCLGLPGGEAVAPIHTRDFQGRTVFYVFIHLPGGRAATLDYVKQLAAVDRWPFAVSFDRSTNTIEAGNQRTAAWQQLPQFPEGTGLALVRRMLTIDSEGLIALTPIIESVQLRINGRPSQLLITRPAFFAGRGGGFRAIDEEERDDQTRLLLAFPADRLEMQQEYRPPRVFQDCVGCHRPMGLESFIAFTRERGMKGPRPPSFTHVSPSHEPPIAIDLKKLRADWKSLNETWQKVR